MSAGQYQCEDCHQVFGGEPHYTIGPRTFLCPVCAGPFLVPDSPPIVYASADIEALERQRFARETMLNGVPGAIDTSGRGDWDAGPVTVRVQDVADDERATVAQVSVYGVAGGWVDPQDWGASFELSVGEAQQLIAALQAIVDAHNVGEGVNSAQAAYRERLAR